MTAPFPKQNKNQRRGVQAAEVVALALSRFSFAHRVETGVDIGVDFICEICERDQPTGKLFNVQCKAGTLQSPDTQEGVSISVKTSTARYWLQLPSPTLLLVADPENGRIAWSHPIAQLVAREDDWRQQKSVSIVVPLTSTFDCFDPAPPELLLAATHGTAHVSVALRERLYEIEEAMRYEQSFGLRPDANTVAEPLMSGTSALQDAYVASEALATFQANIAAVLLKRVQKYCDLLPGFASKWYGKRLRLDGDHQRAPLDVDFGGGVPHLVVADARNILANFRDPTSRREMRDLLSALSKLENLHSNVLEIETPIYEAELPQIEALHALLRKSGIDSTQS